jgi:membrane-bound ClpP family serine protease
MSEEGDTFWVSLAEKFIGLILVVIGAIMIYFTATTSALGGFTVFFGVVSIIMLVIGLFLLLVRAPE